MEELLKLLEDWDAMARKLRIAEELRCIDACDDSYYSEAMQGEARARSKYCKACLAAGVDPSELAKSHGCSY